MDDDPTNVTQLLERWRAGDPRALEQVIPLIYGQLRAIARSQLRREPGGHTLQATALVNEFYLRLSRQHGSDWKDREHFYAFASMLMRRILIDYAKHVLRGKRGGKLQRLPLSDDLPWLSTSREEILALDEALSTLQKTDPRKVKVLEFRALLGCTAQETAELLGISKATADREWTLAKAWLYRELTTGRVPKYEQSALV
jgi:RNA polymerase sigma-70 factor (ECF subfamily)